MVRNYVCKSTRNKFSDESLRYALEDSNKNKGSIRKTAAAYGIPYTTLHAHREYAQNPRMELVRISMGIMWENANIPVWFGEPFTTLGISKSHTKP
jgi:hypothetical protein